MPQNPLIASYEPLDSSSAGGSSSLIASYEPPDASMKPILGGKAWPSNETPAAKPQSFIDRIGGWRGIAATGVRMGAGVLGGEGLWPGAAINAAGETLAEGVEGSDISPTRIAAEGAIGAVPFGEILKAGKIGTSMLRSGLYGAVGTAGRELASGQSLDPTAIATQGAIGAATGGALSKFFGRAKVPTEAAAVKAPEYTFEPTSRTGPGTGGLSPGVKVLFQLLSSQPQQPQLGLRARFPANYYLQVLESHD